MTSVRIVTTILLVYILGESIAQLVTAMGEEKKEEEGKTTW